MKRNLSRGLVLAAALVLAIVPAFAQLSFNGYYRVGSMTNVDTSNNSTSAFQDRIRLNISFAAPDDMFGVKARLQADSSGNNSGIVGLFTNGVSDTATTTSVITGGTANLTTGVVTGATSVDTTKITTTVTPPAASPGAAPPAPRPGPTLPMALALALLGGLILNLMPCVLPVLSMKLLAVVGHGGGNPRMVRAGFLATAAGILTSFLMLAGFLGG